MSSIDPTRNTPLTQTVSTATNDTGTTTNGTSFAKQVQMRLHNTGKNGVKGPDLFAGLVGYQLNKNKGDAVGAKFDKYFDEFKASDKGQGERGDVYAANRALKKVRSEGLITADEAHQVRARAFGAAQPEAEKTQYRFDYKTDYNIDEALAKAEAKISAFESGSEHALTRPERKALRGDLAPTDSATSVENVKDPASFKGSGFLFKPVSDVGHALVVLLPSNFNGSVDKLTLKTSTGKVVEEGSYGGIGNGARTHFRFSKPGSSYPDNLLVEAKMSDNTTVAFRIPDPSQRYE